MLKTPSCLRARLQPCRKSHRCNTALAAEVRFLFGELLFSTSSSIPQTPRKGMASAMPQAIPPTPYFAFAYSPQLTKTPGCPILRALCEGWEVEAKLTAPLLLLLPLPLLSRPPTNLRHPERRRRFCRRSRRTPAFRFCRCRCRCRCRCLCWCLFFPTPPTKIVILSEGGAFAAEVEGPRYIRHHPNRSDLSTDVFLPLLVLLH